MGLFKTLERILLPETCVHCREDLGKASPPLLCRDCRKTLAPIDGPLCLKCSAPVAPSEEICAACRKSAHPCRVIRSAFFYRGPVVSLVHAFKYGGRRKAAMLAGGWMGRSLGRFPELAPFDAVVPVPLHPRRERERGYNQARLIAEALAAERGAPLFDGLARVRATPEQWRLGRGARRENLAGVFQAARAARGMRLLLIDDVCTTGSSLAECAKALLKEGASDVCGYVLARQPLRR